MKTHKYIFQIIYFSLTVFFLVSCNLNPPKKGKSVFQRHDTILPPVVIPAGEPKINNISDYVPPSNILLSQRPAPVKTSVGFYVDMQNFNTPEGLAMSSILCGYKDSAGNLWFGTSGNGVSKYNGKSFINYTSAYGLIHNLINYITEDSQGNIWFAGYGGVSKYNGKNFENFTTEQGLMDNDVLKIIEDSKGILWFASQKGICSYNPKDSSFKQMPFKKMKFLQSQVNDIMEDSQHQLWFAGKEGVWKTNPDIEGELEDFSNKFSLENNTATAVAEDCDGIIWVGTHNGLYRYKPAKPRSPENKLKPLTVSEGLVDNDITCITIDSLGNVWIGTIGGVSKYEKINESFVNFTKKQGLSFNRVNSITEDDAGSLWFGTFGGGLDRYDGQTVLEYTNQKNILTEAIYTTIQDNDGNMWFAPLNAGIIKFIKNDNNPYGGTYINYTSAQGLLDNTNYAAAKDQNGNLYFGGFDGLSKFTGKKFINYSIKNGLPSNNITALYNDSKNQLWIGTYNHGIVLFDGKSFQNLNTDEGLVHKTIWGFLEDDHNNLWIATRGGLSKYDGKNFTNFTTDQGLPDNKLSSVIQDKKGNIIIGSWGGGISILKKELLQTLQNNNITQIDTIFENFSTTQGLANDVVYQIVEDNKGNIVIGTNVGFTVLKGGIASEKGKIAQDGIENYNENTGYSIKDISNNSSMYEDGEGIIWAGTGDKLVRFDYESVHKSFSAPRVFLQDIKINNELLSWHSLERARNHNILSTEKKNKTPSYITDEMLTFKRKLSTSTLDSMASKYRNVSFDSVQSYYAIPKNLELPYSKNKISFDFVGVETTRPNLIRYQYMLDGYDEHWNPITENSTATFGNIHEGDYTFLVKAKSPNGIWSQPLEYHFTILPPWYRAWYAYIFYVLLFFIALFYVDRYQRKRVLFIEYQKGIQRELKHAKEIEVAYTELKSAQAQLIQSEKMASLGELTAGIAHEIQNPLNFVNNFSEVSNELLDEMNQEIEKGDLLEAKIIAKNIKQNLEKISIHGKRADSIVKGMLQHSRTNKGQKEPTNINKLVDEYLRLAYHGLRALDKSFNAVMKTDFDQNIGTIKIIPQEIGRVILNLITNALYACNEKRKNILANEEIKNASEIKYQPMIKVSTKKLKNKVIISIKDNGNGIPKEILDKIFQPFFTTKPSGEGTGLGLSLSYDIIKAHGGELKLETNEGNPDNPYGSQQGTTFRIIIPT